MKRLTISFVCALFAVALAACGPDQSVRGPGGPSSSPERTAVVSPSPLPGNAYRASITIANAPQTLHAGEQTALNVKVKNLSDVTWPTLVPGAANRVDLGNHWLDKNGGTVIVDDGRAELPHDLKPGEEAELHLTVKAPLTTGDYVLELDMVQEAVTWFKGKGSQVAKTNVKVQ